MGSALAIGGACNSSFNAVREAFAKNLSERGDIGAAFAVVRNGKIVVDLWGGHADAARTRAWTPRTVTNVWSTTKGVAAICFAMMVERGKASYDDPVARHWPEFAAGGKDAITIAQLLSHQGGLSGLEQPTTLEDILDQPKMERLFAAQAPLWPPGTACGYHAASHGPLANALFRRIEGRTMAQFVADELSSPFDLDLSIGLPESEAGRASEIVAPPTLSSTDANPAPSRAQAAALANPVLDPRSANTANWRASPVPSMNGFATARGLARLYGALATGGVLDGVRLLSPRVIEQATQVRIDSVDLVLGMQARWAAGFLVNVHGIYGDRPTSYGHSGWGGSFAFADPERGLGVSWVMNAMGHNLVGDERAMALIGATLASADARA
jgi:CubicO group peptidase (beta-lactamase class C family)